MKIKNWQVRDRGSSQKQATENSQRQGENSETGRATSSVAGAEPLCIYEGSFT
ncbi:hypothetical protein PCASD_04115 [Puccinia coronata f. sp. avenae]|uniref:Uncharacterized protein n=1 Tax=Puccinia coronata f. sp. avenae TaxID=200324 RepID=A0A2N5VCH9_9BASI|nr:hypothetical protein PCASD_04115 [Puccinia coronata f. sp. avenae]